MNDFGDIVDCTNDPLWFFDVCNHTIVVHIFPSHAIPSFDTKSHRLLSFGGVDPDAQLFVT